MRVEPCAIVGDAYRSRSRAAAARGDGSRPGGRRETSRAERAGPATPATNGGADDRSPARRGSGPAASAGTAADRPVHDDEPPRTTPPPELRPAGTAGRTPTAAQVRDARRPDQTETRRIDRRRLNTGKRADYDSARRFLAQAEAAVKVNNLMLAESSVEKAETLADGLK